jgi:hypothetical protein
MSTTYIQDVTYGEVRAALQILNDNLRGRDMDPEVTMKLSNNRLELEKYDEKFQEAVEEVEPKYLKTDDDGSPVTEKKEMPTPSGKQTVQRKVYTDEAAFQQEVNEILEMEIPGGIRMESIDYTEFGKISEETLTTLRKFFVTVPSLSSDDGDGEDSVDEGPEENGD